MSSNMPGFAIKILAVGRRARKGHLDITVDGQPLPALRLPAAQWNTLLILIEAALKCKNQGDYWAKAYVSAEVLATELRKRADIGDGDARNIHRIIHKLRQQLSRVAKASLGIADFGSQVLETDVTYGYHFRAAPEALRVILLDGDEPQG